MVVNFHVQTFKFFKNILINWIQLQKQFSLFWNHTTPFKIISNSIALTDPLIVSVWWTNVLLTGSKLDKYCGMGPAGRPRPTALQYFNTIPPPSPHPPLPLACFNQPKTSAEQIKNYQEDPKEKDCAVASQLTPVLRFALHAKDKKEKRIILLLVNRRG